MERVVAEGKHLRLGPAPSRVKGVTYGRFAPRGDGCLGGPRILPGLLRPVVYHGAMGSAPFQTELRDRSAAASMWASALIRLAVATGLLTAPLALLDPAFLVVTAAVEAAVLLRLTGGALDRTTAELRSRS